MRLVVAVSGTPGTGKSVFARTLAKKLGARLVDLNALIKKRKIYKKDADGTLIADPIKVRTEFAHLIKNLRGSVVVEGLLAHFLQPKYISHVVVLRTKPSVLEKRLRKRGYALKKIKDNVESEALSIILWEAVKIHGAKKVYEIDTTKLKAQTAVKLFLRALAGKISLRPGKIDWLEEVF
jgi:adenylate kinase